MTVVANERAPLQINFGGAFAEGMRQHGHEVEIVGRPGQVDRPDLVAIWGTRQREKIAQWRALDVQIAVIELGYIDRFNYVSVSLGGELNNCARFPARHDEGERFDRLWGHLVKPWGEGGDGLICAQCPGDMSVIDCPDLDAFYAEAAVSLAVAGFRPVFRPHPVQPVKGPAGVERDEGDMQDALERAGLVVTWSSNSAVDAVLAGVPVVSASDGCMARQISAHWPDCRAVTPDRSEWFADLAWKQWAREEIASGECWEALKSA